MLKNWSDFYCIGIAEIDQQHRGFFEAAHRLHDRILNCQGEHGVEEAVAFLRDYAVQHFQTEEALMRRDAFPGLEAHRRLHAAFFDSLDQLVYDLDVCGASQHLAERALEVAQDWLIDHIACEDQQYATRLRSDRPGSAPT
jgi:hemerythrin